VPAPQFLPLACMVAAGKVGQLVILELLGRSVVMKSVRRPAGHGHRHNRRKRRRPPPFQTGPAHPERPPVALRSSRRAKIEIYAPGPAASSPNRRRELLENLAAPGMTTADLRPSGRKRIRSDGATPAFKAAYHGFRASSAPASKPKVVARHPQLQNKVIPRQADPAPRSTRAPTTRGINGDVCVSVCVG